MSNSSLLNERQVAEALNVSVASVRRWRLLRQGPTFLKVGASVRYRPEDVEAWLDSRAIGGSTSAASPGDGVQGSQNRKSGHAKSRSVLHA
jgi:predicted DNA-binding transcriptional regulator AlpA